jgi:hypothetical protein
VKPRPLCAHCLAFLASDSAAAGARFCSTCGGNDWIPLTADELEELGVSPLDALELDRADYFPCGHPRTPENTYVELRADRRDGNGEPKRRERCLTCKNRWRRAA